MLAVTPHQIPAVMPELVARLRRVKQCPPLWYVQKKLETGHYQLWLVGVDSCEGIVITCKFDDGTGCIVIAEGDGFLRHLPGIMSDLDRYAEEKQISRWEIAGRLGWARVLKSYGYAREGQKVVKNYGQAIQD